MPQMLFKNDENFGLEFFTGVVARMRTTELCSTNADLKQSTFSNRPLIIL